MFRMHTPITTQHCIAWIKDLEHKGATCPSNMQEMDSKQE